MPLIPCHECGQQISSLAATCPHCGAPKQEVGVAAGVAATVPSQPRKHRGWVIAFVVVGGLLLLIFASQAGKGVGGSGSPPVRSSEPGQLRGSEARDKAVTLCAEAGIRDWQQCLNFISTLNKINKR